MEKTIQNIFRGKILHDLYGKNVLKFVFRQCPIWESMEKKHQTQQKLDKIQATLRQNPLGNQNHRLG